MSHLRVIQWTTGRIGTHALRAILDDPRLELAGVYAHSAEKAGRDAGELCGRPRTGVNLTSDVDELLALGADCVLYAARDTDVDMLARLLESGIDVVCTTTFGRAAALDAAFRQRLETACAKSGSSLHFTGVNPGWINTIAVALTATCRRVDKVTISESCNVSSDPSPSTWLGHGFSRPLGTPGIAEHTRRSLLPFADTVARMADALDIKLDDITYRAEHATTACTVDLGWMRIEKDTIAAVRATWTGVSHGREVLATSIAWRLSDDLNCDWACHADHYVVRIEGDPGINTTVRWEPPKHWHRSDFAILTALPAVNSIPAVCAARPGLLTLREVGLPYAPVGGWL